MIPDFVAGSGNLPPGIHEATWAELTARYGSTPRRLGLLAGLKAALDALRAAGCTRAHVDGSFVSRKAEPGDFDACWETDGVDLDALDPVLLTFADRRRAQKQRYGGELFPADFDADGPRSTGTTFLRFFQRDRDTGDAKGVIALNLEELP